MNKAELLSELAAKTVTVISTTQQPDPQKAAAGINVYASEVMELLDQDQVIGRTILWYVFGEGTPQERAFYKDKVSNPVDMFSSGFAYLASLGYTRFREIERSVSLQYLICRVWEESADGKLVEKKIMAYFDAQGNPTHREIV